MMPKLINMARLVLALLALTAVNAGHCAGGGLENYCCMVACDSSYGTHPGDPNCGGAAASVTRMSDIYAIAGAGGCAPLSPGECSFGVPQETTCTAQLGFDPRTKIGATANTIAAALGNPTPPPAPPATFSPTTAPPTAYPTFSDAFIASKTADGKANAKSGHALYRVGSHTAALPKYVSAHSDFKSILGDGSLLAQGMKHRASIVGVLTGLAPLTGLDNSYPSGSELNVHQGGVEECGTSNIASFANGVISGAVTHKRNLATSKVTCNPGFIGTPSIQCAPIASGGATRGTSEGESGYQWVSVGSCDFDPWYNTGWASTATGTSSGTVATTQSASITGHLVIVHDTAGAKVGCGPLILNAAGENVAAITTIPGYTGSLTVAGTFTFEQAGAQLSGLYTLTGLPALKTGSFHVHAGTSCAAVGGHFATASAANPTPGHVHYNTLGYGVRVGGVAPTCTDTVQNGAETGVDCGGTCAACPTCTDNVQNGAETGVDCGGPCSPCRVSFINLGQLQSAVNLWITDRASALATYGDINTNWDTSKVTSMNRLFYGRSTFNDKIDAWDTSQVTDMSYMFHGATAFNQPLTPSASAWDTSKVTNMYGMFQDAASFNQRINSWKTEEVTNMGYMFAGAIRFDMPIWGFNTAKVTDMTGMFMGATNFQQSIKNWDTSSLLIPSNMFKDSNMNVGIYYTYKCNGCCSNNGKGLTRPRGILGWKTEIGTLNQDPRLGTYFPATDGWCGAGSE